MKGGHCYILCRSWDSSSNRTENIVESWLRSINGQSVLFLRANLCIISGPAQVRDAADYQEYAIIALQADQAH